MYKQLLLVFLTFFILTAPVYSQEEISDEFLKEKLDGRGLNEIVDSLITLYKDMDNQTFFFDAYNENLRIYMTNEDYMVANNLTDSEPDLTLYGQYRGFESPPSVYVLVDNLEASLGLFIGNQSGYREALIDTIETTMLHEILHHIMHESPTLLLDLSEVYFQNPPFNGNVGGQDQFDWENQNFSGMNNNDLAHVNFSRHVFNNSVYPLSQQEEEVIVRLGTSCFEQYTPVTQYFNMYRLRTEIFGCVGIDRTIGGYEEFEYPVNYDNRLNSVVKSVLQGYVIDQEIQTFPVIETSELLEQSFELIGTIANETTKLFTQPLGLVALVIIVAIMGLIVSLITILRKPIENSIKSKR